MLATAGPAAAAPSLEDFAAEHDPDGFHTERELLDLFTAHHAGPGADLTATLRRQQRNARLRIRQMAALNALARLVVEDPKPDHHVLGWFDTAVALRLSDVGITTIGKLVETISAVGYRWYRDVPRLGETGARRISAWLENYRHVNGLSIAPEALIHPSDQRLPVPQLRREPVTAIVPLESFLAPTDLDGSRGANRNLIKNNSGAQNDLQAIAFWLADYENPNTSWWGKARRSASFRSCPPCSRRSATTYRRGISLAIPSACPVGAPLIPALPDNQDIGLVRREAAERGDDVHRALAALPRQAGRRSITTNSTRR